MKKNILSISAVIAFSFAVKAQNPFEDWAQGMDGAAVGEGNSTVHDPAGNVYTIGRFTGTVDFDPGPGVANLSTTGSMDFDVFIQKLDVNGNYLWAHRFGGSNFENAKKIIYEPISGTIYACGSFSSAIDFDPSSGTTLLTNLGTQDGFVVRLNSTGGFVSVYRFGGTFASAEVDAMVTDGSGNLFIAGSFIGTVDFDPLAPSLNLTAPGGADIFVERINVGGTPAWVRQMGGSLPCGPHDMILDGGGNVITTGFFQGKVDFDPGTLTDFITSVGAVNSDIFVNKLDGSGNYLWTRAMGGMDYDYGYSVVVDAANNIYSCGEFHGTADFDLTNPGFNLLTSPSLTNGYVHKLSATGGFLWVKGLLGTVSGSGTTHEYRGIGMDVSGNLYLTGCFSSTTDFDPDGGVVNMSPLGGSGSHDLFIQKLDGNGAYLWAKQYGASSINEYGLDISVKGINEFYVCGQYVSNFIFESGTICSSLLSSNLPSNTSGEILVAKWAPDMNTGWHQHTQNSTAGEITNGVITDDDGNVYVVGTFKGSTFLNGGGNPNIQIISGMGSSNANTYVAKYDECGKLIWVSNTTAGVNCEGTSITYDENSNMVYIGGTFKDNVTFNSSQSSGSLCTTGTSLSITSPEFRGYIAQYDAITGCLNFVQDLDFGIDTKLNSLTVNESNGNLFAGGSALSTGFTTEKRAWVRKYIPTTTFGTSNLLGMVIWSLTDPITTPSTYSVVNDLDYYETSGQILITGTMLKGNMFFNGVSNSVVSSPSVISDAFLAIYNDLSTPTMSQHRAGGAVIGNYMTGEGIAVDPTTGRSYFTGSYSGTITNPFGLGSAGAANLTGVGQNKGFMISANFSGPITAWSRSAFSSSSSGSSYGKDVVANNHSVLFLGEFSFGNMGATGYSGWFNYFGGMGTVSSPTKHVWVIGYTDAGVATSANVTRSSSATSPDKHTCTAIETNRQGYSFVTGQFSKFMGYLSGVPSSGNLVSSGPVNAYVMRVDESNNFFREAEELPISENVIMSNESILSSIIIFPNPTNGLTTIAIDNYDANNTNYKLVLYNSVGKLMQTINITGNKTDVDLSAYQDGIYLLSFTDGEKTSVVRISKTN